MVPLRKAAEEMRNVYANEIARAVHTGQQPPQPQVESWAKYDRALRDGDPGAAFSTRGEQPPRKVSTDHAPRE